ncbi:uncharacterized protein LOC127881401 isoform X48 [Dreissena polymorpha]|uniref:uncharacterized protein LOC127881401 isoform X43 n=1 Tax=Dreissena polymorpha TaxID=45954 RepID=UPI00226568AB|nr:uncharacterized protein LOC127881401 isoform X43 [Dreissena polymorpha]XP_052285211.1 uncharacterized protein LOC127881401 isoform X44 [Dreissena polymorpha]XP_052285212.1 uncharacterized protein LOC127881401 isoform X45 [Dreissena polymorpha]XP_052285213.1 uncharacterized protein LOC127881401 isoform X46 [Dreissena polymorpha]XP_052285214.1 uncharacterized protein LOC127881401 isoform X47 [Dreissena polymorpha]XP_052285215.1 uncharacterized protein LOC127881401 isoform X48 [Dreissena polym
MSKKERLEHWQSSQKQWARMFVKDIYLLFERTRSKLVNLRLLSGDVIQDLMVLSSKMLERVQAAVAVQLFDHRKSTVHLEGQLRRHPNRSRFKTKKNNNLHELRISMLALHLSIEAVTLCVKDTAHTLVYSAPSLADLVLQSHHVVLAVEHAADTFVYFIQEKCPNAHLLCALDVDRAPYILHMEFLKCCYCLVTKYDLVSWNDLRVFTTTNLLPCFNVETLDEFHRFIRKGLASQSALRLTVNRLCTLVECVAKQEVWEEMNNAKFVFTEMLVKQKLLDMLRGKILEITRKKKKFDKMHDLLPKEPLTRIQKLILKRKKAPAVEMGGGDNTNEPGVTYQPEDGVIQSQREKELIEILIDKIAQLVPGGGDMCEAKDPKAALLQESEDMGRQKDTLQVLYGRLCSKYRRDGIDPEMDAARCLSQAVLLPCVALTREEANSTNKFYFENFLHLKFVENLLTEFYSLRGHDLADYMFTSIATDIKDLDASSPLLAIVVQDIVIRIDHVTLILLEDVDDWVRNAVRMGPTKMSALRILARQSSINIMRRSTSVMNWSGIYLGTATRSEMLELQAGLDEDNTLLNASDFLTQQSDYHFGAQQSSIYIIKSVMNWSGVHLGKATRSEMQELQAGLEEDDIPVNVSDYLIEQTSRPTLDLPTEQAPSTTQSIQTSRPVSGLQSATKSQSQGLQSTTKSQSQGLQSTTKSQSQGLQSTTKSQSQGLQSTTKSQSQGLQSTTKSQSQGLQSTTESQSQVLQSATKSQSQGLQSATESQSQGLRSTTESQSQGLQSTTESQSQGLRSTTMSQLQGVQSTTKSHSQGLQSTTESQSQGLQSTTKSQSQGLQSTTKSQSQGLQSTTKSQSQGLQSTTKSQSQVMLVSESVQEADIGLKIGMLDEVQKINSFTDIINDVPMSASVAEADTKPNIGMQDEVKINSFTDIINELSPLKKYMVFVKNEEIMHSVATQGCYIQRRLEELNYIHQVHISNIMDSYYMLEEGDDSQTLTRAGLYQLEHDCTGEARKPLRGFVKSLILLLLFAWIVLCTVYVTVIGAQLGDKELQEWMCYFLASLLEFALVLEPLRAVLVSLYVKSLHWKLWRECNCCR